MISSILSRKVHPDCRAFVAVVEELLERRRQELLSGEAHAARWQIDDWGPRKWHRTELEDTVYSSYKRMRQGSITRPPRRQIVMDIADYLNCSLAERNRLLLAAHLLPVEPYHTGGELQALVRMTAEATSHLPMPLMIINRDWRIHYASAHLLALYDISAEQLAVIPPERLNVLHLLFDPALPFYANVTAHHDSWQQMALQTITGFKMANRLCQHEPWYQETVDHLMLLPEFSWVWQQVRLDQPLPTDRAPMSSVVFASTLPCLHDTTRIARLRPLLISAGYFEFDFPLAVGFVPADDATRTLFQEIGLPFPPQNEH